MYIHIGTEKTGSSYLQSLAAINTQVLVDNGVYFPLGTKHDDYMLKGIVSYGNAQNLYEALKNNDFDSIIKILTTHKSAAIKIRCESILLSNELLLLLFSDSNLFYNFEKAVISSGFKNLNILLVLREPVEQVISLYKHRAKNGKMIEINNWVQNEFLYPKALKSFFEIIPSTNSNITIRKYKTEKGHLEKLFLLEWINIQVPTKKPQKIVNPSLSFSEILLLQEIRKYHPIWREKVYEQLISVAKNRKAENSNLDEYFIRTMSARLSPYFEIWQLYNKYLPSDESFEPHEPETFKDGYSMPKDCFIFSKNQMEVIIETMYESTHFLFRLKLDLVILKRKIGQLKKEVFSKLNYRA